MTSYQIRLIFRNFRKNRSSFFINFIGLSSGLAAVLLIYLWVNHELSFDKFHKKGDRIFQVMENTSSEGIISTAGHTQDFLGEVLTKELPEIEQSVVVTPNNFFPAFTLSCDDRYVKGVAKFVSKEFLDIFSYPLLAGNPAQALTDKNGVIISETLAKSLFKTIDNSIGKSIDWQVLDLKRQVNVTGVFKDLPANSTDQFSLLLTFDSFRELIGIQGSELNWDNVAPFNTYVLVKENTDINQLNRKIAGFIQGKSKNAKNRTLFLTRFSDNYLHGNYKNGIVAGGRIEYVELFSILAFFILLIACINFINLSTAKVAGRIKEVGIKKSFGVQRKTIIWQFLGESALMIFLSLSLAILLVQLFLPQFIAITGKQLHLIFDTRLIVSVLSIGLLTTLLAGIYPAVYFSGFSPVLLLKGQINRSFSELRVRKGLVIFQFIISAIFIVSVLVVYKQIEFVQNKNLGFNKENVLYFEIDGKLSENTETFITEIKSIPGVVSASSMLGNIIGETNGLSGKTTWNGKQIVMGNAAVNYDMIELLGIQMKEGRTFSRDFSTDKDKIIYNEAAIEALGITDPVGKIINGKEILGVAKNFHFQSLHELIKPYCFRMEPQSASNIMVKIKNGSEDETIKKIQKLYTMANPGFVFNYRFLDQDFQVQYAAEKKVARLSLFSAVLAIIISCLGLLGLATFTAEKRRREIGIRKVLGSSEFEIVRLLSGEFTRLVIYVILVAMPISYLIAVHWLNNFAYRIQLTWSFFVFGFFCVLSIALLTVSWQSWKAATRNPVEALRYE